MFLHVTIYAIINGIDGETVSVPVPPNAEDTAVHMRFQVSLQST